MQSRLAGKLHVGIIMDGNGRWANRRGLSRTRGHEAGADAVRRTVKAAAKFGIGTLTLYAFSSDNWKRPKPEIAALMSLLSKYLEKELSQLVENGVRLTVIGRRDRLPRALAMRVAWAEKSTVAGRKLHLRIALDYSAREAILDAAKRLSHRGDFSRETFARLISGDSEPQDVDLIIRTSGEQRLSDFLLWESAYAELCFVETLWPDFGEDDLRAALKVFFGRNRRFGGIDMEGRGERQSSDLQSAPAV